jgi:hypothetical protein
MEMSLSEFFVSLLAAGGGAAVVAFTAFRLLGESWMNSLFNQKIEAFRHENAKELQALKAEVDGALQGRLRVQEKEFEVLAKCWDLMNSALGSVQAYVSPLQSYPDIARMSESARIEYLASLNLFEFQRQEIMDAAKPNDQLQKYLDLRKRNVAAEAQADFQNFLRQNEIFIADSVVNDFDSVASDLRSARISKEVAQESHDFKMGHDAWKKVEDKCAPQVKRISNELRAHIRGSLTN